MDPLTGCESAELQLFRAANAAMDSYCAELQRRNESAEEAANQFFVHAWEVSELTEQLKEAQLSAARHEEAVRDVHRKAARLVRALKEEEKVDKGLRNEEARKDAELRDVKAAKNRGRPARTLTLLAEVDGGTA